MTPLWYIAIFCFLVSPSVRGQEGQECLSDILENHGLELNSWKIKDGPIANISDAEACKLACCRKEDCDRAVVERPQDEKPRCFLVSCKKDGKDECRTRSRRDFTVYTKKSAAQKAVGRAADSTGNGPGSSADPTGQLTQSLRQNDNCTAPMVVGPCRASFSRYYYNGTACQKFIYGGCGGNGNNFEKLDACNAACSGTSGAAVSNDTSSVPAARKKMALPDNASSPEASVRVMAPEEFKERCEAPMKVGPCRAAVPRYFYNHTEGNCRKFIYGGCRGNKNNYDSEEECYNTCSVDVIPKARKAPEENSTDGKSTSVPPTDCMVEPDVGPCRASFSSFYFDSSTQSCLPFTYGGCKGNSNRFASVAECMARCSGPEGATEKHGPRASRMPAHVMVGTLVVVTIVALVGLLVMLRRSSFRRRIRDDKEELLPEDQLSTEQNA